MARLLQHRFLQQNLLLDQRLIRILLMSKPCRARSSYVIETTDAARELSLGSNVKPMDEIPGPKSHWSIRLATILLSPGGVFKGIYKVHEQYSREYGPLVKVTGPNGTEVWVTDPNDVATVFRADVRYPRRTKLFAIDSFRERHRKEAGVFFLNGENWHKHRSVLSQRMLKPPEMNKYTPRLNAIVDDVICRIEKIKNKANSEKAMELDDLDQELFQWSFESVCDMLFDRRFETVSGSPSKEAVDFIESIGIFLKNIVTVSVLPAFLIKYYKPKAYIDFETAFLKIYYYAELFIHQKMEELGKMNSNNFLKIDRREIQEFIPFLLSSEKVTPDDIVSSIVDTLFAGVDTTSNTMQWMLYLLCKNQDKQELIRNEVDKILPDGKIATTSDLAKMPYLKAAIKETLRLYPVLITHQRILQRDVVLSGYHVPAGSNVMILNHAMSRSERLFDSPYAFRPERWLREHKSNDVIGFSSTPFGHGVRMCLGRRLAELELQLLLVRILQTYSLEYGSDEEVHQYLRGTNIPDRPVRVKFINRK